MAGVEGSGVLVYDSDDVGDGYIRIFDTRWGSSDPVQMCGTKLVEHHDIQFR